MISSGELDSGYGVQDGVALHYIGTELKHVISDSHDARAYHVKKTGFRVIEKEIKPDFIGRIVDVSGNVESPIKPVNGNSIDIVKDYIRKINEHDLNGMLAVTTEDTVFIDSMGINASGKSNMREAWNVFLTFFPDYKVRVKEIIEKNGLVAIFGTAAGTLATDGKILEENRFEIPASWTAVVKDGKIAKWRVYADNEPVRKLIGKYEK
jgi:ketosteroid isomerase-like protein